MVFKVEKNRNYTVMSNYHLKQKNMSLKAKGLLSVILSLPDNWDYSQSGLVELSSDEICSVRTALNELKALGYVKVIKRKPNETASGRFEYEYIVYENPQEELIGVDNDFVGDLFDRLWKRYPKKESEKQARSYFQKLNPNEELVEEMLTAINRQRRSKKWSDSLYIPLFVNWLKGEKWKDIIPDSQLSNFDIEDWAEEKGCKW